MKRLPIFIVAVGLCLVLAPARALADPLSIYIVNQMDHGVAIWLDAEVKCELEPGRSCMVAVPDGKHSLVLYDELGWMGAYDVTNPGAALHMRVFEDRLEPI